MDEIHYEFVRAAPAAEIIDLYRAEGWWRDDRDTPEQIAPLIRGSFRFMTARTVGGRLVGMGRVLSDGVADGYIQDIVVSEDHRGRGVGAEIVRRLVAECEREGIEWIALIAVPGTQPFYERLGFKPLAGCTAMRRGSTNSR